MVEPYLRQSPLEHLAFGSTEPDADEDAPLLLAELRFLTRITLRGAPDGPVFEKTVGLALPRTHNSAVTNGERTCMWLGPDEWLLISAADGGDTLLNDLTKNLTNCAVVDVSEGNTALRVQGQMCRELLSTGCPLDLHPDVFEPGCCTRTLFARATVIIHHLDNQDLNTPAYDLHVERSFAEYVWKRLVDSAQPYGGIAIQET